jgi:predicted acylesterase/phospholipase RssA
LIRNDSFLKIDETIVCEAMSTRGRQIRPKTMAKNRDWNQFDRYAVITVQGGGVYGLNLLGQLGGVLKALKPQTIGFAGTSAGAIIATLCWAGYTPDDLLNLFKQKAGDPEDSLVDLLGGTDSFSYEQYEAFIERATQLLKSPVAFRLIRDGLTWSDSCRLLLGKGEAAGLMASVRDLAPLARDVWLRRGFFKGERLEKFVDELLRRSPRLHDVVGRADELTFGAVRKRLEEKNDRFFVPPLVLTATNLTKRKLALIGHLDETYSNVSIARAVRASAGFPVVFHPVRMPTSTEDHWFADGGMVSNFPSWIFTQNLRERMDRFAKYRGIATAPWMHIGLRVVDDEPDNPPDLAEPLHWFQSLLAMVRGSSRDQLEEVLAAFVKRSWVINQSVSESRGPKNLFDMKGIDAERVQAMYDAGHNKASAVVAERGPAFDLPPDEHVGPILRHIICRCIWAFGEKDNIDLGLRCNVFLRFGDRLVMVYAENMGEVNGARQPDTDLFAEFPLTGGNVGMVCQHRQPHLTNLAKVAAMSPDAREKVFHLSNEIQQKIKDDRSLLLSVPIFDWRGLWPKSTASQPRVNAWGMECHFDGPVFGALSIDCRETADFGSEGLDPGLHSTDPRIQAMLDTLIDGSLKIGALLSDAFGGE